MRSCAAADPGRHLLQPSPGTSPTDTYGSRSPATTTAGSSTVGLSSVAGTAGSFLTTPGQSLQRCAANSGSGRCAGSNWLLPCSTLRVLMQLSWTFLPLSISVLPQGGLQACLLSWALCASNWAVAHACKCISSMMCVAAGARLAADRQIIPQTGKQLVPPEDILLNVAIGAGSFGRVYSGTASPSGTHHLLPA